MSCYLLLISPLAIAASVGFWCLIVKMLALAGWQRLATHFQVARLPAGPLFRLAQASVGGVRYRGVMKAGASAEGLALKTGFPFGVGHPPLLVPWSAVGAIGAEKFLWMTTYSASIQTGNGNSVAFTFASNDLLAAARPWIRLE